MPLRMISPFDDFKLQKLQNVFALSLRQFALIRPG
jgi:hypothetical protein